MTRSIAFAALLTLGLLAAGCSSSSQGTNGEGPGDGTPTEGSNPTTPATPGADAPREADAAAPGEPVDERLYPIAVGNTWTYDVATVGAGAGCAAGVHEARITSGPRLLAGKQAYETTSFCAAAGVSQIAPAEQGDQVDLYYDGRWLTFIDPNLTEGHTWTYFNTSYTWHKEASVTVPAGTFSDCWTAKQNVAYTAYVTYCRGVGTVRSYSKDLGGNGWDAKLTKKSF